METAPLISSYSTSTVVIVGLILCAGVLAAIIGTLYWINTRMRRSIKHSQDDWRQEQAIEAGHTLHAEGIYGSRHHDEGGRHLKQEDPHPPLAGLKTDLDQSNKTKEEPFKKQENRNLY